MTVKIALADMPLCVPVIVMLVFVPTFWFLSANVAVVAPAATVTDAGMVTMLLDVVRVTTVPPAGAGAASVTVPVEVLAPVTVDGFSESEKVIGLIVRAAVLVTPP